MPLYEYWHCTFILKKFENRNNIIFLAELVTFYKLITKVLYYYVLVFNIYLEREKQPGQREKVRALAGICEFH